MSSGIGRFTLVAGSMKTCRISPATTGLSPTLASIMGLKLFGIGSLRGRVLREALVSGPSSVAYDKKVIRSKPAASGKSTVLLYQQVGGQRYLDEACFAAASRSCE